MFIRGVLLPGELIMKSVIIGTAGHIDHGKTALVKALTGVDTDRLPEEKARGITIDLGFAHVQWGDIDVSFIDVPGHEKFVKNMLAGIGGIDLLMLVIAADESDHASDAGAFRYMPSSIDPFGYCCPNQDRSSRYREFNSGSTRTFRHDPREVFCRMHRYLR